MAQTRKAESGTSNAGQSGPPCSGCGQGIREKYVFMVQEQSWHASCLRCSHCQESLVADERCFAKDGRLFCQRDYLRLFGQSGQCVGCGEVIAAGEQCMRISLGYLHMSCLSCAACQQPLQPRNQFYINQARRIVCSTCQSHHLLANVSEKVATFNRNGVCGVENLATRQPAFNTACSQVS